MEKIEQDKIEVHYIEPEKTILALEKEKTELLKQLSHAQERIKELEMLSQTDALTGLLNRRGFNEQAPRMFELYHGLVREFEHEGKRSGIDISFNAIYIDLNDFKPINDTYQHAAGDQALKNVADALRSVVRKSDSIFRMGGDEFVILSMSREGDTEKEGENKLVIGERIINALEKTGFIYRVSKDTPPVDVPPVTAMIGIATARSGQSLNEVVEEADRVLKSLKDTKDRLKALALEYGEKYIPKSLVKVVETE